MGQEPVGEREQLREPSRNRIAQVGSEEFVGDANHYRTAIGFLMMIEKKFSSFLKETIVSAGALLQSASDLPIAAKQEFDLRLSQYIINAIVRTFPEHSYISEEEDCTGETGDSLTWIIDPIDGSENFYRGLLAYSISMSLVRGEEILLGAVYEPYADRLFYAERSSGAMLNGYKIRTSQTSFLQDAVVAISRYPSFSRQERRVRSLFHRLAEDLDVRILASTALGMCYVAIGATEGQIMANTRSWDNSAATLIVREAGGLVSDWNGADPTRTSRQLLASNGYCHMDLLKLLRSEI